MEVAKFWRTFLAKWPSNMPQKGVVVANGEQVSFIDFLISEEAALFDRLAPDAVGGRKLIVPYVKIEAIKITESVDMDIFVPCGFLPVTTASSVT